MASLILKQELFLGEKKTKHIMTYQIQLKTLHFENNKTKCSGFSVLAQMVKDTQKIHN